MQGIFSFTVLIHSVFNALFDNICDSSNKAGYLFQKNIKLHIYDMEIGYFFIPVITIFNINITLR